MSVESSPPRTIFEHDGHAYTAKPAAGAQVEATIPDRLAQIVNDENAVNAAVLVVMAYWTVASASATINNARAGAKTAALLWALSCTGGCLAAAYLFWSLL